MEPKQRRFIRATWWVGIALAGVWLVWVYNTRVRLHPADGAPLATNLLFEDASGEVGGMVDFAGSVVLVNAWASWCGPCRAEVPGINQVAEELASAGLVVLGLNVESLEREALSEVAQQLGIQYRTARPIDGWRGTFQEPQRLPFTWLIDREGRVRAAHSGFVTPGSLRDSCRKLLSERGGP